MKLLSSVSGCQLIARCLQRNTQMMVSRSITKISDDEFKLDYLEGEHEGIAVFTLQRHAAKNAFGRNMIGLLRQALDMVRFDSSVRSLIIRSTVAGVFCAGADLKERVKMKPEEVGPFVSSLRDTINVLDDLPVPTIAAIEGAALGGGLEMALACDIRIASHKARIGLVETRLAIIPGAGGTQRLPRLIGPSLAKELIFTSRILTGCEAKEYSIVNHVVDTNENGDSAFLRALEIAKEITQNGPVAIKMAKQAINKGSEVDLGTGLAVEQGCYAQVIPTKDRLEGLNAFREKRKPVYRGE